MENSSPKQPNGDEELKKPTLLQVFASVLSAIFGVQNNANRERDFTKGDPKQFIAVYIIIVIAFVVGMALFVRLVLSLATTS